MYKVCFNLKSFDLDSLSRCENYLLSIFKFVNLNPIKHQVNPQRCQKITVCRSPHIDKKSREQFQLVTHKKTLECTLPNRNLVFLLLEILKDIKFVGIELELVTDFSSF